MTGLLVGLVVFVLVAAGTPGANNVLAAHSGARFGVRGSMALLAGIWVSMVATVAVSAAGLGGVIVAIPVLDVGLRVAGSAYLLWLAMRISRSGRPDLSGTDAARLGFRSGLMVTWLNPKAWTVAFSAAAGFAGISSDPLVLAAVIAGTFGVILVPVLLLWCGGGQLLARVLRTDRQWRVLNIVLALLLVTSIVPMWVH